MAMYIDTISPTLQAFNDTVSGLQQMKNNTIEQRLKQAQLLRDMGYNKDAEKMLSSARNYGLSSLLAGPANEWEPKGAFDEVNPALKSLVDTPVLNEQQKILNELQSLYGDDKQGAADYSRNLQMLAADISNRRIQDTDAGVKDMPGILKSALLGIRTNEKAVNEFKKAESQNEQVRKYNADLKPVYKKSYTGNEVDQQQGLMDDTIKAIKKGGGLAAYNKYLTTGKAISDHYGHDFKALPAEYFGLSKNNGGGGSGKPERINIFDSNGKLIGAVKSSDAILETKDPAAYLMKKHSPIFSRNGITDPTQFTYKFASGEGSDSLNDLEKENLKGKQFENDMMSKATAMQAWNDADPGGIDLGVFKKSERAALANASLPGDNPWRFDENGNLANSRSTGNIASSQKNKPWKAKSN